MTGTIDPNSKPILLVEDNDDDVFLMKRAMRNAGMPLPLHIARHGKEAIDYLNGTGDFADRKRFPMPAFIFLDLKLPYHSGFEVLDWIRQSSSAPHLPVIVLTSSDEPQDIAAARKLGANSYLVKPTSSDDLEETIRAVKAYWCQYDQLSA